MSEWRFTGTDCTSLTSLKAWLALLTLGEDNRVLFFVQLEKKNSLFLEAQTQRKSTSPRFVLMEWDQRSAELYPWCNLKIKDKLSPASSRAWNSTGQLCTQQQGFSEKN